MYWWPGGWWPAGLVALVAWLLVVSLVACWPGGLVAKCYVFGFGFGGLVAHCHQATKPPNHKQTNNNQQRCCWWPWWPAGLVTKWLLIGVGLFAWSHQAISPPGHQATKPLNKNINMFFGLVVWWHQATRPPGHQATRPPGHQTIQQKLKTHQFFHPQTTNLVVHVVVLFVGIGGWVA